MTTVHLNPDPTITEIGIHSLDKTAFPHLMVRNFSEISHRKKVSLSNGDVLVYKSFAFVPQQGNHPCAFRYMCSKNRK